MRSLKFGFVAGVLGLASSLLATNSAQAGASVFVVHGIPGTDLNLDLQLPVDVSLNGTCVLPGFTFGEIVGPINLPAGSYDIAISLANPAMPCANDAVISAPGVMLDDRVSYSIVAYLTDEFEPTAGVFVNDLTKGAGKVTVNVFHTAAAPTVDVTLNRAGRNPNPLVVEDLTNGDQAAALVRGGAYKVTIAPAGSSVPVFGPVKLMALPIAKAYLVYAVGSLENETFTLLVADAGSKFSDDDDDDDDDNN